MTVRELVKQIQVEIRDTPDLLPDRAAALLMKLTALLGNINDHIRDCDGQYALVLLTCMDEEKTANRARIRAETSQAYQNKREARDCKELALELVRSLKYYLRGKEEEMRLSGGMH